MKTTSEIRLENLESLIREAGSVKRLAERSGISRVYISQLRHRAIAVETGNVKNIGNDAARKFEAGMGKPVGWMDTPHDHNLPTSRTKSIVFFPSQGSDAPDKGYITFELLDVSAAAGDGGYAGEFLEVICRLHVLESWARAKFGNKIDRIRVITAHGTSMQPTIDHGDILFVDHTVRFYDGDGIYVISRENMIQVKRLQLLYSGSLVIISDNHTYQAETLSKENVETININGRVLAAWSLKSF